MICEIFYNPGMHGAAPKYIAFAPEQGDKLVMEEKVEYVPTEYAYRGKIQSGEFHLTEVRFQIILQLSYRLKEGNSMISVAGKAESNGFLVY